MLIVTRATVRLFLVRGSAYRTRPSSYNQRGDEQDAAGEHDRSAGLVAAGVRDERRDQNR
jgi:hypothetical protein